MVQQPEPPERPFGDVVDGKSGNRKLCTQCSYCITPETKILLDDFTWVEAGNLSGNEGIFSFTEEAENNSGRKYTKGFIKGLDRFELPCVKVTTDRGTITVSKDHKFLTRTSKGHLIDFREAQSLKEGYEIYYFEDPWDHTKTLEKEYLAGFLDGEGCFSKGHLSWSQVPGKVSSKVLSSMESLGYTNNQRYTTEGKSCETFRIYGGVNRSIRVVGEIRPVRLLEKAKKLPDYSISTNKTIFAKVLKVEDEGEKEIVALSTSTRTYISDGYLSHNCDFKYTCWPDVRTFLYSGKPRFLTKVVREPKVPEVTK